MKRYILFNCAYNSVCGVVADFFSNTNYYFVSVLIIIVSMLPFFRHLKKVSILLKI